MAGRLDQFDDFPRMAENNVTGPRPPMVAQDSAARRRTQTDLDQGRSEAAIVASRERSSACMVFYCRPRKDGSMSMEYIVAVVPKRRMRRLDARRYLEIIDVLGMRRKTMLRGRIIHVRITSRKFDAVQEMIGFK